VAILFVSPREMRILKAIGAPRVSRSSRSACRRAAKSLSGACSRQFRQQVVATLATENLDFFYDVVRRMEQEDGLATRQIAAALAFLAQREQPLQPKSDAETSGATSASAEFCTYRKRRAFAQ
jgi:ATP-dependent RNA helicase DeaD